MLNTADKRFASRGAFKNASVLSLIVCGLLACGQSDEVVSVGLQFTGKANVAAKEYVFTIHTLHNIVRPLDIYGPLLDYRKHNIPGVLFRLEAARNAAVRCIGLLSSRHGSLLRNHRHGIT